CLYCDKEAELAIQQKKITPNQRAQYIMNCAQENLASFIDLYKDGRNNTVFTAQKQCLQQTCQSATLAHAAYSMNALSDLRRIHAHMLKIFTEYVPKTLYEPCVEDMSVLGTTEKIKNALQNLLGSIGKLAKDPLLGGALDALGTQFATDLKTIEMPVFGCVNRSLALIQKLEADKTLLEQYKAHLQNLKLMSDSLKTICHDPRYQVWQETPKRR
ncbi:MAG: hypothetical protein ACK5O4_00080, partial [bacterium]